MSQSQEYENTDGDLGVEHIAPAPEHVPPGKMTNVFSNKKTRNVIFFTIGIIVVISVLVMLSIGGNQKPKDVPQDLKGVNAGNAPDSMTPDKTAIDSPRFNEIAKANDARNFAAAEKNGGSIQPTAVGAYTYQNPTQQVNSAVPGQMAAQDQQAIQAANAAAAARQAQEAANNAMLTLANQAAARNIALWDAPHGAKMLIADSGSKSSGDANTGLSTAANGAAGSGATEKKSGIKLISAGLIAPLQINVAINSAEPGTPVVGTLLSGDLKGSVLTGTFTKNQDDTLRVEFKTMNVQPYNVTVSVDAFSLNPDDQLKQGIVTDTDQHLFLKYLIKPSAAALAAVGQALSKAGSTINSGNGQTVTTTPIPTASQSVQIGAGAAANQLNTDISAQDTATTVMVKAKTVVGVVFVKDVIYDK